MRKQTLLKSMLFLMLGLVCNVAWAEVTLPTVSTGAEMHFYRIKSARTGKYAAYTGDNTQLAQTTETTSSTIWYVTATASNKYRLHNLSTDKKYASVFSFTADGSIVYIKENPHNAGYVCVSTTENLSSNCWDDQGNQTKIGNYNPRSGDAVGTSWTFEEVTVNEGLIAESYSITLTETTLNDTYTGNFTCYGYGDVKLLPLGVSEMGASLTNVVWGENTLTADIKFPLPVSKEGNARPVVISGFKGSLEAGSSKYYVDGTNVKARPSGTVAKGYDEWEIYPTFANGVFTFVIKNVGADKYIKSNATTAVETEGTITVVDKAEATSFALEQGNRFKLPDTSLYLSIGSSSGTKNLGLWGYYSNNGGVHYGVSNFVYLSQLPCVLTDAAGNEYTGTLDGTASTLPSFPRLTVSNKAFNEDGTNFTATVTFPFSVSSEEQVNATFIANWGASNDPKKWCPVLEDGVYNVKVYNTDNSSSIALSEVNKWRWAIYPQFADGTFTYLIKNVHTGTYVYANPANGEKAGGAKGYITLQEEGTAFTVVANGNNTNFAYVNNENKTLKLTTNGSGDNDVYLGSYTGGHAGNHIVFSTPKYTVTTGANGYAAIYTPMAVTIPSGVTACVGSLNDGNSMLSMRTINTTIPANTAVILQGTASTSYEFTAANDVAAIEDNDLQGALTSVEVSAIEGSAYTFNASNETFIKVTEGTIPAYSAYIVAQSEAEVIATDAFKFEVRAHLAANASKLGEAFGKAYYVANGEKLYTADAVNAAIDAATTVEAVNAIKESFKYNIPAAGTAYYLKDNHGTYLDLHHLSADGNGYEHTLATMSATKQLLYITGDAADGTWKIHTAAEGGNYLHQSSSYGWNSKVSSDGGNFKWEVEGVDVSGTPHYMLKNISGHNNGYLGADSHTAGNALYVDQNDAAKKLKMQLLPVKSITLSATTTAEWLNEECVNVPIDEVPGAVDDKYNEKVVSSGEYFYINKGYLKGLFQYRSNSGNYRADIVAVEVIDLEGNVVAADYHWGYTGNESQDNTYAMDIPEDGLYYVRYYAEYLENGGSHVCDVDITYTLLPATGYYYMSSRAVARDEHLYNNALHAGNATKRLTLQSNTRVATNNGIWYISYNADGSMNIKNGDGNAIVPGNSSAEPTATNNKLNIERITYVDTTPFYSFTEALNCSQSGFSLNGINILTTWAGHPDAADNQWRLDPVSIEGKTIYEVVVNGDANAYVAYNDGTTTQNAFNGGFFIADEPITEAQLKAGFAGSVVKSATITIEENVITVSDVEVFPTPEKIDLYNTSNGSLEVPPYRIPGITVDPETGRIITTAARLVCGTDPGYGQVDVVCRISDDNGENWSEMKEVAVGTGITSPTENYFDTAFGDPAVVADRTSNEVLIIVVAGCTKYQTATRAIPNEIGTIHSLDNGNTWREPVRVTEQIYSLFDAENGGNTIQSAFVGGGKIFQSRIVKVGQYYRLYAAMCARPNGNRVIYSDDFGRTWHALGGPAALPAPGGDEPKCEEMPDGRVVLSSRVGGGRIYNIYTYSNTETAEGSWGTSVTSTFEGSGKTHNGQSTNGEILIVPVQRNSDKKEMYLALQSLPAGGGRSHVGIFYKELTDMTDINSVANFAIDWNGYFEVTDKTSAYSSMDLQNDDRIGFIYEENYTKHGVVSNPHSIDFPDANNLGTHNYDGYDNIYVAYPLEIITNNAYSIKRDVDRREFLRSYFTDLTADAVDEVKAAVATKLEGLSTEPAIGEVDNIYFTISKVSAVTAFDEHAGKAGFFTNEAVATYKTEVMAATQPEGLAEAKAKLLGSKLNIVSGKAYTFKNVQKDGTTVRWYKYDGTNIVLTATESEATPFVCRLLDNGKYVFVCNNGKYMTWRAVVYGCTTTGVNDAYHGEGNFLTDITIAKMTAGGQIASGVDLSNTRYVSISANRPDKNPVEVGYVVVKKNGGSPTFDGAGNAYYNDNYSSAFIMEEAAFGNTPKVNGVGESGLMSEDLHGKHMSTFSATYATVAPEGVTAYYATKSGENVVLNAIAQGEAIPANTGVILVSEEGGNVVMLPAAGETAADVTGNLMVGTAGAAKNMDGIDNAYILTGGAQGAGFYLWSRGTLAAGKAYLQLESTQQALRIRLADDATEIEMPIANGQQPAVIYDLTGRRVEKMEKGIYIVNGKKVVIK